MLRESLVRSESEKEPGQRPESVHNLYKKTIDHLSDSSPELVPGLEQLFNFTLAFLEGEFDVFPYSLSKNQVTRWYYQTPRDVHDRRKQPYSYYEWRQTYFVRRQEKLPWGEENADDELRLTFWWIGDKEGELTQKISDDLARIAEHQLKDLPNKLKTNRSKGKLNFNPVQECQKVGYVINHFFTEGISIDFQKVWLSPLGRRPEFRKISTLWASIFVEGSSRARVEGSINKVKEIYFTDSLLIGKFIEIISQEVDRRIHLRKC